MTLSASEQQTLDYLREYVALEGWSPSFLEIAKACGLRSTSAVAYRLDCLEARGLIRRKPHTARAISLVETS